jgi:hypothetical protein
VKDEIVNLEIAVNEAAPVMRLGPSFGKEFAHVIKVGDIPDWLAGLNIDRLCLSLGDGSKGLDLATVEV